MIGLISDTHDNMDAIRAAVDVFNCRKVELVLHAGDIVSPFTARAFKELRAPMKAALGNNDGDPVTLAKFFGERADFFPGWQRMEFKGRTIYLTHRPLPEPPSDCDIYVHGHTHAPFIKKENELLMVNPGECSGWLSGRKTIAVISAESLEGELVEL